MSHSAAISITSRGTVVKWLYPFLIALVLFPAILYDQILNSHSEVGRAFIRNYNPTLGVRNRCVVQDKQGLIYIASEHGVHEYDGVTWRIIEIPHALPLMSLASAPDNRIYIGATNDFGYLAPDSLGTLQFISLLEQVPPGDRDFGHVWNVHATKEGIYFQTRPALFRWSDKGMRVWKTREWIHLSFMVRGDLYLSFAFRRPFKCGVVSPGNGQCEERTFPRVRRRHEKRQAGGSSHIVTEFVC